MLKYAPCLYVVCSVECALLRVLYIVCSVYSAFQDLEVMLAGLVYV